MDTGVQQPAMPRPDLDFTRLPQRGASAAPVLYDLDGDGKLEVVQASWDGHLYAFEANGSQLPGWPVEVTLPPSHEPPTGYVTIQDHKLDASPSIGDLNGDGTPEIVIKSQYTDVTGAGIQPAPSSHLHAYEPDGTPFAGFPVDVQGIIGYYGSAQEFITEGVTEPVLADVNGDGSDEIAFTPGIFSQTDLLSGNGSLMNTYGPVPSATADLLQGNIDLSTALDVLGGSLPEDAPVSFTNAGAFGKAGPGGDLIFAQPGSGGASVAASLLFAGSGGNINNYERAYDALSAGDLPGFPSMLQGLDFLGSPVISDVTGDGQPDIVNAADSSALQAFDQTGGSPTGFPKFTSGWVVFAPAVGDLDSDGKNEIVSLTREGYLFVWKTDGQASANDEWWRAGHDEWNTDAYGTDTRPPGVPRDLQLSADGHTLTFTAPGDDWYAGTAKTYHVVFALHGGGRSSSDVDADVAGGGEGLVPVPPQAEQVDVYAVDEAANRGPRAQLHFP
jgi:hypothetical protein